MKKMKLGVVLAAGFATLLFTGCASENELLKQRNSQAVRHYEKSKYKEMPLRTLTLQDCIRLALANTLDRKAEAFYVSIADPSEMKDVLVNLPGFQYRYDGKAGKGSAFAREGEELASLDLDLALGFMDWGLAYFNYRQDRNREWSRKQNTLRMAQNLALDVTKAYVDFVAAQRSVEIIRSFQKNTADARKIRGLAPYRNFGLFRDLNDVERQLLLYEGKAKEASARLCAIMGYHPASELKVESPVLDYIPDLAPIPGAAGKKKAAPAAASLTLPDLEMLEKIALLNRPELARNDGKEGVSSIECAKVILTLFPQLRLFLHYNGHKEDFLYNRAWWDLGIGASFNLLNLFSKGMEFHARYKMWEADKVASYASGIAVISQVRLCHSALLKSLELLKMSDMESKFHNNDVKRIEQGGKKLSPWDKYSLEYRGLHVRLRRMQRACDFYLAANRLTNALGLDNLDADNLKACQELLLKAEEAALKRSLGK